MYLIRFGELARNWREEDVAPLKYPCTRHYLCRDHICLWTKEWLETQVSVL